MLDLNRMRIVRREAAADRGFAFVGVRKSPVDGTAEFWLPQGFQEFPERDFAITVHTFFLLYRVLRAYVTDHALKNDASGNPREPFAVSSQGTRYSGTTADPLLTFGKINFLEGVVTTFDELVLPAIVAKATHVVPDSYEQIYRHLQHAIYSEDDTIYLDRVPGSRTELIPEKTDLVGLFCYVYTELAPRLRGEQCDDPDVTAQAQNFKEKYLADTSGLFSEESFAVTLEILKDVLARVDRTTAYKDDDYWRMYEAIEAFLYGDLDVGQDGFIWGITDFHPVWEDMCQEYISTLFAEGPRKVVFAHTRRRANSTINRQPVFIDSEFANPFHLNFNSATRNLLPDVVLLETYGNAGAERRFDSLFTIDVERPRSGASIYTRAAIRCARDDDNANSWLASVPRHMKGGFKPVVRNGSVEYRSIPVRVFDQAVSTIRERFVSSSSRSRAALVGFVVDFKYINPADYYAGTLSAKIQQDIVKQHAYQLALQFYGTRERDSTMEVESQFVVPLYVRGGAEPILFLSDETPAAFTGRRLHAEFERSGIKLVALSFEDVATTYVSVR